MDNNERIFLRNWKTKLITKHYTLYTICSSICIFTFRAIQRVKEYFCVCYDKALLRLVFRIIHLFKVNIQIKEEWIFRHAQCWQVWLSYFVLFCFVLKRIFNFCNNLNKRKDFDNEGNEKISIWSGNISGIINYMINVTQLPDNNPLEMALYLLLLVLALMKQTHTNRSRNCYLLSFMLIFKYDDSCDKKSKVSYLYWRFINYQP